MVLHRARNSIHRLAGWVLEELDAALEHYVSGDFVNGDSQPTLPFVFSRTASAWTRRPIDRQIHFGAVS